MIASVEERRIWLGKAPGTASEGLSKGLFCPGGGYREVCTL